MRHARPRGARIARLSLAAVALCATGCGEDRNYHPVVSESTTGAESDSGAESTSDSRQAAAPAQVGGTPSASQRQPAPSWGNGAAGASESPTSAQASSASPDADPSADAGEAAPSSADLFEPDGTTPSETGRNAVRSVVDELSLPSPPPVAETPGDEPFQKLARDRRFDEFRRKAARYVQLRKQLLPLGRKLGDGTATPAERALHNRIEAAISIEFKPLNRYMWDERWTEADRAAMGWILFVQPD